MVFVSTNALLEPLDNLEVAKHAMRLAPHAQEAEMINALLVPHHSICPEQYAQLPAVLDISKIIVPIPATSVLFLVRHALMFQHALNANKVKYSIMVAARLFALMVYTPIAQISVNHVQSAVKHVLHQLFVDLVKMVIKQADQPVLLDVQLVITFLKVNVLPAHLTVHNAQTAHHVLNVVAIST
jgi:hypothetical protein